jgi:hypothetical protein
MKKNMRTIAIAAAVILLWQPLAPVRAVTAQALYTAGDLIAR